MGTELPRLVALTPGDLSAAEAPRLVAAARRALESGLPALLLREATLSDRAWLELWRALAAVAGEALLIAHDRCHLARVAGARAVHLGFRSLPPAVVRATFGFERIGLSTHAGDAPPDPAHVDHVFHGPVRDTPSKHGLVAPVGFEGLAAAVRTSPVPVLALGGLVPEDVPAVRAAGAHGLAVLRGVLRAADPAAATEAYLRALEAAA